MAAPPPPSNCVILGPAACGKTSLLGVLQIATAQEEQTDKAFRILPVSPDMGELIARFNASVREGRLPSVTTTGIKRYVFDYEVMHSAPGGFLRQVYQTRFHMIDTPGGALLGDRQSWAEKNLDVELMAKARTEAIEQLRTATSIMLCADSTDEDATAEFIQYLPSALMEVGVTPLACRRLVVCLTKADKYVLDTKGAIKTSEEFRYEDAAERARRVIGKAGLNTFKFYLRDDVDIRAGWASVYGFDPKGGLPNYDPEKEGLLIDATIGATAADILERWHPYRVIDPFVFLTMGASMNLQHIRGHGADVQGMPSPKFVLQMQPFMTRVAAAFSGAGQWFGALYRYLR